MKPKDHADVFQIGPDLIKDVAFVHDRTADFLTQNIDQLGLQSNILSRVVALQSKKIADHHGDRTHGLMDRFGALAGQIIGTPQAQMGVFAAYLHDATQRMILTMDALRERGDVCLEHEGAGCPPVLSYDYDVIVDGATLDRPCNYQLLRIRPPAGVEVDETKRPYVIIDPRAGHGAGIGGFKPDNQVGVALSKGHPVYFVSFERDPVPGQTLADVMHAEAGFVRTVRARHPDSPQPVVTGNCQGGWAALLMAACNPDLTGPLVLNGAPVAPWAGAVGENPMRYNGGVLGGAWQPMFWSDLGAGQFDGANLVTSFELLNPSRNHFGKYFDLYRDPEGGLVRFLDFERWWGGYFILNEAEILWTVEQLFVGNRLVKNTAQLEPGNPVDIKAVKAPIFVFASHGDNITPPQQALNWIAETYADTQEIKLRGQRIIYMLHDEVGHLGIFVSSKVARKEHTHMASTLETVEAMAPGLYEMQVEGIEGEGFDKQFKVHFVERSLEDVAALDDGRHDETSFAAAAHMSEVQAGLYEAVGRPFVQALSTPMSAKALRDLHPLRLERAIASSRNPAMKGVQILVDKVRDDRKPAMPENPYVQLEDLMAECIEQAMNLGRDLRDAWYEATFYTIWGGPWATWFGQKHAARRTLPDRLSLRKLPKAEAALSHMAQGGLGEAIVRILILLANSHQSFRVDMLDRWAHVFANEAPFSDLSVDARRGLIHEQTIIVAFDVEGALDTLPDLLPTAADRAQAVNIVRRIIASVENSSPGLEAMVRDICKTLDIPVIDDVKSGAGSKSARHGGSNAERSENA